MANKELLEKFIDSGDKQQNAISRRIEIYQRQITALQEKVQKLQERKNISDAVEAVVRKEVTK